jgi:hypothetical protein
LLGLWFVEHAARWCVLRVRRLWFDERLLLS